MARLPDLGSRGEGWVLVQLVLLTGIGLAGLAALPTAGWSGAPRVAGAGLGGLAIAGGALLATRGVLDLGANLSPFPRPTDANRLVETGVFRLVRHPVYSGLVLAGVGWSLLTASPVAIGLSLLLLAWLDLKSRREEAWLAARHPGYAAYAVLCGGEPAVRALRTAPLDPGDSDPPGERRVRPATYPDCEDFVERLPILISDAIRTFEERQDRAADIETKIRDSRGCVAAEARRRAKADLPTPRRVRQRRTSR